MKTVLCYGDSLTWGFDPRGGARHAFEDRWPSRLQEKLGQTARVIAEGLNGRTTAFDDHVAGADRNGARILPTVLTTQAPVGLVVIMLGANDMKPYICGSAIGAKQGMQRLIDIIGGHDWPIPQSTPEIVLVSPPPLCATGNADFAAIFADGEAESRKLAGHYEKLAADTGCAFFDAGAIARTSPLDGVHLDVENTRAIGDALAPVVQRALEQMK